MSTIGTVVTQNDGTIVAQWANLGVGETGVALALGSLRSPKTIQINGTFGGGTIAILGSNDGVNWDTMSIVDLAAGVYVLLTGIAANQFAQLIENPRFIRPVVAGGVGTALNVIITCPSLR